jgi:hypothetical protein
MQISFAIVPFRPAAFASWDLRQGRMDTRKTGRGGGERKG